MPIRSMIGGWVPSSADSQRGGSGSARFWRVIRCSNDTKASASPVSSSENASARRSIARESCRATTPSAPETTPPARRERGQGGRSRTLHPRGQPRDRPRPPRGDQRQIGQQARDIAVAHVRQLVRDDRPRLGGGEARQQRVVEDHAAARAEPVDVGVGGVRAAARVDLEDLADADAGALGEVSTSRRSSPSGSGVKSLKIGSSRTGPAAVTTTATATLPAAAALPPVLAVTTHQRGDDHRARRRRRPPERAAARDIPGPARPTTGWRARPGAPACASAPPTAAARARDERQSGAAPADERQPSGWPARHRRRRRGRGRANQPDQQRALGDRPGRRRARAARGHSGEPGRCRPRRSAPAPRRGPARSRRAVAAARPPPLGQRNRSRERANPAALRVLSHHGAH